MSYGSIFSISVDKPSMPKLDLGLSFLIISETSFSFVKKRRTEEEGLAGRYSVKSLLVGGIELLIS